MLSIPKKRRAYHASSIQSQTASEMVHVAKLGALTDELVTLITSFSPQNQPNRFNAYRESALRSLRYSNNARTNQFDVAQRLDGLEEKFRVYNEDPLADALRSRLDELASRSTKWTPDILHLLLELSDQPVFKSKLSDLQLLKPPEVEVEPSLRWEDLVAEDPALRERHVWKNIDYGAESSDEEDASFESNLSDSGDTQTTELSIFEEHEEILLENITLPTNNEGLDQFLKAQFWTKPDSAQEQVSSKQVAQARRITELQAIREVLFMVSGSPTSIFTTSESMCTLKPVKDFELKHASSAALQAILRDLAHQGSALLGLRTWAKTTQKLPLIQSLQSAIEKRLRIFDKRVSDLQTAYVSPEADVVVSLLEVQVELSQAIRPLLELAKIIRELESEPYAHAFRYLELLYNKVCISQMAGEEVLYKFMGTLFFECFSVYLRPLRRWMEEGEVKRDDKVFFVTENIYEVEPSLLWEEKFMLRKTPNGSLHAPQFLHTSANTIFTTGKSVVVLKKLRRFDLARGSRTAVEPTLDFDTVCGSRSLHLATFSELFDVAFEQWIRSKHHAASSLLRECLYKDCGLWTSLHNLENLFFMKTPTAFPTTIFEKLDQLKPNWNDRFTLTELAKTTVGSLENFDSDRLSAIIHQSTYNDVQRDRKTVSCLSSITLHYRLPWAIQMIITPTTIAVYQNLHTFLLQTLRAGTILSSLPLRASLTAPTRFATTTPEQSLHYSLRTSLLWFTNLLTTYLTSNILTTSTAALKNALATAKDVDEMITVHKNFAKKIEDQALLGRKIEPIHETIIKILDMAIRLSDLQHKYRESPEAELGDYRFEYSTDSVRATPVKQRSTLLLTPGRYHKKRRDSLSDSSDSSDSESNSEEDGENKESKMSKADIRALEDEAADAGTYFEQLQRMKEDFKRMCRFVSSGLRGVARVGGESGSGKEWDVLAEMIEVNYETMNGAPWDLAGVGLNCGYALPHNFSSHPSPKISTKSSLVASPPLPSPPSLTLTLSNSPTLFQNLLKCLVPLSHKIVTILFSLPPSATSCILNAVLTAATTLTALLLPTKIPSLSTNHLAILIASTSVTLTASSINSLPTSKFSVNRFIPMPSTILSTCCRLLVPSFSVGENITPCLILWYNPLPSGSARMILMLGSRAGPPVESLLPFRNRDTPEIVPPVPAPATNASSWPPVWW